MALGRIWGFLMIASVNHGKDGSRRASEWQILVAVEEDMLLWGIFRCNLHIKQVCHSLWNWLNWIGCSLDWHISKLTPRGVELGTRWWLKDKINCCVISHHVIMWELWVVGIANTSSLTSHLYTHYNWNQDLTLYKRVVQGLMKKTRKQHDENHSCLLACPQPYLLSAIPTPPLEKIWEALLQVMASECTTPALADGSQSWCLNLALPSPDSPLLKHIATNE